MRTLRLSVLSLFLCLSLFAQSITFTVTEADGTTQTATISGPAAAAGIDSAKQWLATQKDRDGNPKYAHLADMLKQSAIDFAERISLRFPSASTKAIVAEIAAKQAALDAARKALMDAARGQQ
jgi:hypothetical protein